ncbi:MAG TPA: caspase family protein [Fimbriimonas sp.]|nr:caspase family protein [Fimbriimonas sp.]
MKKLAWFGFLASLSLTFQLAAGSGLAGHPHAAGQKYAIIVGINKYNTISSLSYCKSDADAMKDILQKNDWNVRELSADDSTSSSDEPTLARIKRELETAAGALGPDDTFMFYFAGHGFTAPSGGGCLATFDTTLAQPEQTSLKVSDLIKLSTEVKAKKKVFIFDACRNTITGNRELGIEDNGDSKGEAMPGALYDSLRSISEKTSAAVFLSCSKGETSKEDAALHHGCFTYVLVDGLHGEAATPGSDSVSADGLRSYVIDKVKSYAQSQNPFVLVAGSENIELTKGQKLVDSNKAALGIGAYIDPVLRLQFSQLAIDKKQPELDGNRFIMTPGHHEVTALFIGPGLKKPGVFGLGESTVYQRVRVSFPIEAKDISTAVVTIAVTGAQALQEARQRDPALRNGGDLTRWWGSLSLQDKIKLFADMHLDVHVSVNGEEVKASLR